MTRRTPARPSARASAITRTPAADVEGAVLDAADRLVAEAGPAGLIIRRLATEAGVAPMSIYNRFTDRAGVLQALFTRGFTDLHRHTVEPARPGADQSADAAVEQLTAAGRNYRAFAHASPGTYSLMFDRAADFEPSTDGIEAAARSFNALVDVVQQAQHAGAIVGGSPIELAQRIWASIHGAVSLELRSICFVDDTESHFDAILQTLIIGLAPDRGVPGISS